MAKHSTQFYITAALSAAITMLSACGGTTEADNKQGQENIESISKLPAAEQPQSEQELSDIRAEIVFPTPQADLGEGIAGNFTTVTVRVTSEQAATAVTANGIDFQRDNRDSDYWYGRVPVATGETELEVALKDQTGNQTLLHQTLNNHRINQISPASLRQTDDGRIYYLDHDSRLYQAHSDGSVEAVSERSCRGNTLSLNAEQTKAYLLGDQLCEVDLLTKQVRFLYDLFPPYVLDDPLAPHLIAVFGVTASAHDNAVFISLARQDAPHSTFGQFRVLKIDVATQEVTEVPIQNPPTVYLIDYVAHVSVADAQTMYVFTSLTEQDRVQADTLFAIDIASGDMRSVTAVNDLPRKPDALRLATEGKLELLDINNAAMAEVDLDSGNYQLLDEPSVSPIAAITKGVGSGPQITAKGFALGEEGNDLYVTTDTALYRVDLTTGDRFKVGDINCVNACEIELDGNTAYVLEQESGEGLALVAMDIISGTKTLISGESMGAGGPLFGGEGLALDKTNNRMFVATGWPFHGDVSVENKDAGPVMEVDLNSGNRRNAWYQRFDDSPSAAERCGSYAYGAMDVWIDDTTDQLFVWAAHVDALSVADVREPDIMCRAHFAHIDLSRSASPGYSSFSFDRVRQTAYFSNREYQALTSLDFSEHYSYVVDPQFGTSDDMPMHLPSPNRDSDAPLFNKEASGVELAQTLNHFHHANTNVVIDEKNAIAYMNGEQGAIVALSLLTGDRVIISH